mmetsp:Transcript_38522/g.58634  ORF Transcript_38522/g.58634 Transcript_38522/m.58634 type:complete len:133 (-) Transcript_38522:120-518(-)
MPTSEMFSLLTTNSQGECRQDASVAADPSWIYLDGTADNRDWALSACPTQSSVCGSQALFDLTAENEVDISMEADVDLNNHCTWTVRSSCDATGILPSGLDDDWFVMYTEFNNQNVTLSSGWPAQFTSGTDL